MNLLSINNIDKSAGNKILFENISFGIESGQKTALIGTNGCGKTTLLKLAAGLETSDKGKITKNRETVIDYLEQNINFNPEDTISEFIFSSENPLTNLIKKYEEYCMIMTNSHSDNDENEFHRITEEMDSMNAWEYEFRIKSVLTELEIDSLSIQMKYLSGGMIKKAALAHCLIGNANLLIMDEPTNHLDLKTIRFLEDYLKNTDKALLLVTHDRYFLDSVCGRILEIDRKSIYKYEGNYSYYLEKKSEMEDSLKKTDDRVDNLLRKELEWYKRQPKARTTKSKSRMDAIDDLLQHEKFKSSSGIEITLSGRKLGKKILELKNLSKSFGDRQIIKPFSHVFKQKEKTGIIGPNGSGKTTFLNIITGNLASDTGTIDTGLNTQFGYFSQTADDIDPALTILEYIRQTAELIKSDNGIITAEKLLERFLFPISMQRSLISTLSGGEKRRLQLLKVLMSNPNFLILDEPTNDLDITTLSILENFLEEYDGCLIVVTHDRYFINRVIDHLFVFDLDGNIKSFPGNYNDYIEYEEMKKAGEKTEKAVEKKTAQTVTVKEKTKLTFKEKKELEETENRIALLEKDKKDIEEKLGSGSIEHEKIREYSLRYEEIEKELGTMMERWEYLASFEN